jgi:Flp pilus assembly protein CpaB
MQSKTPLLMVTALICGLGAAFGTWKLVSGAQAAPSSEEVKVKVLVPVADIQPYFLCQDSKKFTEIEFPKHKLREAVEDTITSFDQIKGRQARHYKLRPNEPVYKTDFCENSDSDIAARLKPGETAASISTNPNSASGGFIQVGDHVNVAARLEAGGQGNSEFGYILNNIEILAVDNLLQRNPDGSALPTNRMVLRVTVEDALILKAYQDTGKLDVMKRQIGDPADVRNIRFMLGRSRPVSSKQEDDVIVAATVPLEQKPLDEEPRIERKETPSKEPGSMTITEKGNITQKLDDGTKKSSTTFEGVIESKKVVPVPAVDDKEKNAKAAPGAPDAKKPDGKN